MNFSKVGAKSSAPLIRGDFGKHQELLQPLYRASANLKGRFRASVRFRPIQVIKQIVLLQLCYWFTVVAFQLTFMTLPTLLLVGVGELHGGWKGVYWPSFGLLFTVEGLSRFNFLSLLNCVCFLASGFIG